MRATEENMLEKLQCCTGSVTYRLTLLFILLVSGLATAVGEDWNFVARINQGLSEIVPDDAQVEKVSGNFGFLEGPVWVRKGGYLLFSDIPANVIYKFNPTDGKASVAIPYSGFSGADPSNVGM